MLINKLARGLRAVGRPAVTSLLLSLGVAVSPQAAFSATITADKLGCDYLLMGEVTAGDYRQLTESGIGPGETLCLHSPGGDVEEGNTIAKWLEGRNIKTVLPPMSECYSICAIIFMAGSEFEDIYLHRRAMHVSANLGFHAPYLLAEGIFSAPHLEASYATALEDLADWMSLGAIVERGDQGFIPPRVILELLKRGPHELYMVDTVYKAKELNIELLGAPQPEWSIQNLCNACKNNFDGHYRTDICNTAQETNRTDNAVDLLFYGVGGEGSYQCGVRLERDPTGALVAKIDPYPIIEGDELSPVSLAPEMALESIGH